MSSRSTKNLSKKSSGAESSKAPVPGFTFVEKREHISEYRLTKNGLAVLVVHVPRSQTVTTTIVYHVGSRDEKIGETGIAHMFEHMLFKRTTRGDLPWKVLEDKGALLNANTYFDRTLYYFNMPKEYLGDMLAVEADRMQNVDLTDKEFQPERANVLSEFEMYNSRPEAALEWNMLGAAFASHPYRHDTIGFRSDIESFTTEKLKAFYDTYYEPHNATLIIAGDIETRDLLTKVKNTFGHITPRTAVVTRTEITEPIQEGERRVTLERKTPMRIMSMAFKSPAFLEKDWLPLSAALSYLTLGETSPLHRSLVDSGLATNVSASLYPTRDPSLAFIQIYATEKASYEKIESCVYHEIQKLSKTPLKKDALESLTAYLYAEEILSRDGTYRIAQNIAECVSAGDWKTYTEYPKRITKLKAEEILNAARTYLIQSKATIGIIKPV